MAGAAVGCSLGFAAPALATSVMQFPDNGTQQMARGGAWVARATNPLAVHYNPAALPTQSSGALLNVNLVFNDVCYERSGPGLPTSSGITYPEPVCNDNGPTPLPSLAAVLRLTEELGVGYALTPPSLYGTLSFPDLVKGENERFAGQQFEVANPGRYQLLESTGIVLNHTFSAGYSITEQLHVGAGFIWGMGSLTLTNGNMGLPPNSQTQDAPAGDLWASVEVSDWFIPGVVIGALWEPIDMLDVGFSFKAQEAFDGSGDVTIQANYWDDTGLGSDPIYTRSADREPGLAHFRLPNPLEVKLGVRFHVPRGGAVVEVDDGGVVPGNMQARPSAPAPPAFDTRDPLAHDIFDVELDLVYTRNSAFDAIEVRFPEDDPIDINIGGAGGAVVPANGDVPLRMTGDTLGVRLGGDFVAIPNTLAVRAGGWYEPDVQPPKYLNVSVVATQRIGLALGAQYRLGSFDIEAGYMHVFFGELDNGGNGAARTISGNANGQPIPFRSPYPINGGKVTQSANIFSLGATARF